MGAVEVLMGISEVENFERYLKSIQNLDIDVEVYFDGSNKIIGKISRVASDFFELYIRVPGGTRKALCPFWSVQYVLADYERPAVKSTSNKDTKIEFGKPQAPLR
jgi:hypothetical protein